MVLRPRVMVAVLVSREAFVCFPLTSGGQCWLRADRRVAADGGKGGTVGTSAAAADHSRRARRRRTGNLRLGLPKQVAAVFIAVKDGRGGDGGGGGGVRCAGTIAFTSVGRLPLGDLGPGLILAQRAPQVRLARGGASGGGVVVVVVVGVGSGPVETWDRTPEDGVRGLPQGEAVPERGCGDFGPAGVVSGR